MTAMFAMAGGVAVAEPGQRSVTVRVVDSDGTPLEGAGVVAVRSPLRPLSPDEPTESDANGIATVTFDADDDEQVVRLIVLDGRMSQMLPAIDDDILSLEFVDLMEDFAQRRQQRSFEPLGYPVRLDDLEPGSIWTTRARPMLPRPGRAVDMHSMYIRVVGGEGSQGGIVEAKGAFQLRLPSDGGLRWLTAPELMAPVERYVPLPPDNAEIVVRRQDFELADDTGLLRVARQRLFEPFAVQFVRVDGACSALAAFGPRSEWGEVESVRLPAGSYYILHSGEIFAADGLDIALQAIADGDAETTLATLPTVRVHAGATTDLALSVEEIVCGTEEFVHAALFQPNLVEALWPTTERGE